MNNIENFDTRLELFLKNKMTEEEGRAFLSELQSNQELRERAQAMAAAIKNMKELQFEHGQRISSRLMQLSEPDFRREAGFPQKTKIISFNSVARMGIAACFVAVMAFGGYRYHLYNETITLGNNYYAQLPTELVVRDADDITHKLSQLFDNVKDKEGLKSTIKELESIFSLAVSDEYNEYTNYMNDIGWNLSIAHLKAGNRADAIKTLEILIYHTESDMVIEKCKKLIEEINRL